MTTNYSPHYVDKDSKADLEMIESPNLKDVEQARPVVGMQGVVPVGQIEMTDEERKLHKRTNLKMDIFVLPILSLLYLMNGLDRSNIGNAATVGFAADVGMPGTAVNNAVTLFFITFLIFQPISAGLGKAIGIKIWIPFLMTAWGLFTLAHAYVKSEGMLIAFRLMIGVFEAGFYPCAAYALSACYVRYDLAFRVAIFYGTYAIAGAFSGVLAYGLLQIKGSLHSWQYLFIFEGCLTIALAIFAFFWLPARMSQAWFLKEEERAWVEERMHRDSGGQDASGGITKSDIIETIKDWKFWLILPCNIAASVPSQAFSVFLPLIVKDLGYSSYRANLFSVPIYVCGAVGLWVLAWHSDRKQERGLHIIFSLFFVFTGLVMVSNIASSKARYGALCILQIGSYSAPPLTLAWLANNTPAPGKRALILGLNGWGNLAGVIGAQLFKPMYAPKYHTPFLVCLGINIFSIVGYSLVRILFMWTNAKRRATVAKMSPEEIEAENMSNTRLGDKKVTFQFSL